MRRPTLLPPRLLLVAFCLLCWLPGWFTIPATDRDEARFVQATRQMIETGDVVSIRNGPDARNRKPIGIHWLQLPGVLAARALGLGVANPVWPYRLPSIVGALLAVLCTHAMGVRLFGPRAGLLAAAMLGGSVLLTVEAHIAKTDAALLGATSFCMLVLARLYMREPVPRWLAAAFWVAAGIGILVKGPILPLVAGLAVAALVAADWRASGRAGGRAGWLRGLRPGWGVPLMLAVVLPWFVAIGMATRGAFFRDAVGGDLATKIAGGAESHWGPPGTHLALLSLTLFPSGWAAIRALPNAWSRRREPAIRFLLAWLLSWLVFEAVPTKLPHYVLPLLPPLALLAAIERPVPIWVASIWVERAAALLTVGAAIMLAAGAAAVCVLSGWPWWQVVAATSLVAAAAGAAWLGRLPHDRRLLAGLLGAPILYAVVLGWILPSAPVWLSHDVARAAAGRAVAAVGYAEPSLRFEAGTGTRFLDVPAAAAWLGAAPARMVAVEQRRLPAFVAAAPGAIVAGSVAGIDVSNGRRTTLTLFVGGGR